MNRKNSEAARASLLRAFLPVIEETTLKARDEGIDDSAVFVLDPREPFARTIAELNAPGDQVAAHIKKARRLGVNPVLTWCVTRDVARRLVAKACPKMADVIGRARPEDGYLTVVIAAGGVSRCSRRTTDRRADQAGITAPKSQEWFGSLVELPVDLLGRSSTLKQGRAVEADGEGRHRVNQVERQVVVGCPPPGPFTFAQPSSRYSTPYFVRSPSDDHHGDPDHDQTARSSGTQDDRRRSGSLRSLRDRYRGRQRKTLDAFFFKIFRPYPEGRDGLSEELHSRLDYDLSELVEDIHYQMEGWLRGAGPYGAYDDSEERLPPGGGRRTAGKRYPDLVAGKPATEPKGHKPTPAPKKPTDRDFDPAVGKKPGKGRKR